MWRISALGVGGLGYISGLQTGKSRGTVSAPPAGNPADLHADVFVGGFSRGDLLAMNAGVDQASRASNALSTADDAIGVIGGLLGNIQTVLKVAGSAKGGSFDAPLEQRRIDSAVTTIDALASSSRFGGRNLLDGTFSATTSMGVTTLPSFISSTLGSNGQGGAALSSIMSGQANALSSGNLGAANRIVDSARSQVHQTQSRLTRVLTATRDASIPQPAQTDPAADMLANPSAASTASANSSADRVLALLA